MLELVQEVAKRVVKNPICVQYTDGNIEVFSNCVRVLTLHLIENKWYIEITRSIREHSSELSFTLPETYLLPYESHEMLEEVFHVIS